MDDSFERAAKVCDDAGRLWLEMPAQTGACAGCSGAIAIALQIVARHIRALADGTSDGTRIQVAPTLRVIYGIMQDGREGWAVVDDSTSGVMPCRTAEEALDAALERARDACS